MTTSPALFLDKDGTLIPDVPYNVDPAQITLVDGALATLRTLAGAGYRLIVITNQSGVARGYFDEAALTAVEQRLRDLLAAVGLALDGFYYCPHHPDGVVPQYAIACGCRKPAPGLLQRAAREQGVDLAQSWFVGDILNDVEAGNRAGCRTILIDNGNETEWVQSPQRVPTAVANELSEIAQIITSYSASRNDY